MGRTVHIGSLDLKKECGIAKRLIKFIHTLPDRDLHLFDRVIAGQLLHSRTVCLVYGEPDLCGVQSVSGRRFRFLKVVGTPVQIRDRDHAVCIGLQSFLYERAIVFAESKLCSRKFL